MVNLEGRVAIITGASSGIGRATAQVFAGYGARLALADVDIDGGHETEKMVKDLGAEVFFAATNVADESDVTTLIALTEETYGRLDVAFNNAGVEGIMVPTPDVTVEDWDRTMTINLKGVWLCMRAEIPAMLRSGGGSIVNAASVAGLVGFGNLAPYTASKHGVVGLTKTAALEYATQGIRVNAVCPGVILTPMVKRIIEENPEVEPAFLAAEPIGRFGQPSEIGEAVAWLSSDAASLVTGHAMAVDGAFVAQ